MACLKVLTVSKIVLLTFLFSGCVNDDTNTTDTPVINDETFDFIDLLANYADTIIIPNYQNIQQRATQLSLIDGVLNQYCTAIGTANESSTQMAAQATWKQLNAVIQRAELHTLGPATDNNEALRQRLTAYDAGILSRCGIDQSVVLASTDNNFSVASRTANQRGIGAVEYLLFNEDLTHTCPTQVIETANWNTRPSDERKQLRCEYALLLAADIASAATTLVDSWSADGGNYRSTFINPDNTGSTLEAVLDALFYLDITVKDSKLGIPTGISNACGNLSCPDKVEFPYSETSLNSIRHNLDAFQTMLTGGDGLGFDDIIAQAGVAELNSRFTTNIANALSAIDAATLSLRAETATINSSDQEAACTNAFTNPANPATLSSCRLYGLIKLITDDLKIGFTAAVNVDLPDRAQSDND